LFPITVSLGLEKAQTVRVALSDLQSTGNVWGAPGGLCDVPCPWDLGKHGLQEGRLCPMNRRGLRHLH